MFVLIALGVHIIYNWNQSVILSSEFFQNVLVFLHKTKYQDIKGREGGLGLCMYQLGALKIGVRFRRNHPLSFLLKTKKN